LKPKENVMSEQTNVAGVSGERLKSFIDRIERLNEEKDAIAADIKEVMAEAKGTGFDLRVIRTILKLRKMDSSERSELEELVDVYKRALDMG
jgi:uncharacterized protein (UPF0335 family)